MLKKLLVGDIFLVPLEDSKKCFFQFIGFDEPQLNSELIRVFKKIYPEDMDIDIDSVVEDDILLYAHTHSVLVGQKDGLWDKVGHSSNIGDPTKLLFNSWLGDKNNPKFWHVWHINGQLKQIKSDNKLLKQSYKGGTFLNNDHILKWIKTKTYPFFYPEY